VEDGWPVEREVGDVFLGTHTPRLDDKGRLFLPAKFRDDLAEGVVITRGQERCLYVWPRAEFIRFTEQLRDAPFTHRGTRDFARMLAAGASDEVPDKQGRVTIPAGLRNYAGLDRECTVVGAMTRVEIWSTSAWEDYQSEKEPMFADISEEVLPGVF
jgi:MraZ protein